MKFLKQALKRVKLKTLIILVILLMFNSYAWFVYSTRASTQIRAHIESWNVTFQTGSEDSVTNIEFNADRIYPGMEDFVQEITARNLGEKQAKLSYVIKEITILENTYSCEDGETTTEDLEERIRSEEYPFHITISMANGGVMEPETGASDITISLTWPFEQNNDGLDTYWGELAYEYYTKNPNKPSIAIKLELKATQIE